MIPDYQSLMLPLMRYVEDGMEHRIGDVVEPLKDGQKDCTITVCSSPT